MRNIRFIALIALMMGGMTMKAQDYHPIVEDGKQWNVLFTYPWNPPEPQSKHTDIYKIEGDTLVDGVSYKVMYTTRNENITDWSVCGVIRENEDKQVFYRRDGSPDEQMLYDFSMQVGDTIFMYEEYMVVIETGEIIVGDDSRQQIVLEYPFGGTETWIEGIGSLYGIIDSGSQFLMGGSTDLLCYYEDGDLIWQNTTPGYNECYIVNSGGGQQSGLVVTPTVLTFDEPAAPQTFTISNQYDIDVTITNIYVEPDDNTVLVSHTDLPQTLQPTESMTVEVELNAIGNKGYNTYHIYVLTSEGAKVVVVRVNENVWDEYIPLIQEDKNQQWNVVLTYVPWPPINRVTNAYKLEGDTVVDGTSYKMLLTTQSEQYDNWELWGLLRETDERQVFSRKYRWDHTFASETLLYDFSIEPGDSFYGEACCLLLLRKSDTILDDGTIRKRYDFQYKEGDDLIDEYETWIEGIGSEYGLLHSGSRVLVGGTYDLLCYYEDEDPIWQNPQFNSCYIDTHSGAAIGTRFFDEASGLYYNITSNSTVEVTYGQWHFNTYVGDIIVPPTVDYEGVTYTVTAIGEIAFGGCEGQLNSVIVPNTVTTIGESAFASSPHLSLVILPNSIESFGQGAFARCYGLTSLRLPEGFTTISENMFFDCMGLTTIEIPSSVTRIEKSAFEMSYITHINIPESVTYIGESAFKSCTRLTSIDIPNSVTEIGPSAFYYCLELQSAHLPETLEVIPESLFERCPSLSSIDIPATVTEIGASAFCYNTAITELVIPDAVQIIGDEAFLGCSRLSSITLSSHLNGISAGLFQDCTALHSITIPQSVIAIFSNAFKQSGVVSVTFEGSLDGLGNYAFSGCTGLNSIVLPTTAHIGAGVFNNCSNLETVVIGPVVEIGTYAFGECSALQTVTLLQSEPPLDGGNVFAYCNDSVKMIVPCGAKEAYENSDWGNEPIVIEEDCGGLIEFHGSEWYYEILNNDGSITYQYLYQAGDTVVHDEPTHILVKINTLYDKGEHQDVTHEYVYERDGKVYWWNKTLEEFTVLYDLDAQVGDSWTIKVGTESLTMHVDAVNQYYYEDQLFRMLTVSDEGDLFSGTIVCGVGHLSSFFPERLMTRGKGYRVNGLRCYWNYGNLHFTVDRDDCDAIYVNLHNGVNESTAMPFALYPNPTDGILFVETVCTPSLPAETYRITNLMGQTVLSGTITAETQQIDVSALPQGMYFITFAGATRKFVVR